MTTAVLLSFLAAGIVFLIAKGLQKQTRSAILQMTREDRAEANSGPRRRAVELSRHQVAQDEDQPRLFAPTVRAVERR